MSFFLQSFLTSVLVYKYYAIFLITFFAALELPLPATAILVASAFFATEGYLSFVLVFMVGAVGNILGDAAAYWLARKYGQKVLLKVGLRRFIESKGLQTLEVKLAARPHMTIFFSRFAGAATPVVSFISGHAKVPVHKFLPGVILGDIADAALLCACGFFFGDNWRYVEQVLSNVVLVAVIIALMVLVFLWRKLQHAR